MDEESSIVFREPVLADALSITRLVKRCPPLDVNSHYVALLLCRDFHGTCVVAERERELVGFLSAYRPPGRNDTIFVWQIAADPTKRSGGLASRMLDELIARDACAGVRFLEATITPSNAPSRKLFQSFARRHHTECSVSEGFPAELFGETGDHEPEELHRIGPFHSSRA